MNLVACDAPAGVLDRAPHTALRQDTSTENWDGFWGSDDRYYARCTTSGGRVNWFRLDDGGDEAAPAIDVPQPSVAALPVPSPAASAIAGRHTVVFRVGRSASHGCVIGVRRPIKRSRARSADFTA